MTLAAASRTYFLGELEENPLVYDPNMLQKGLPEFKGQKDFMLMLHECFFPTSVMFSLITAIYIHVLYCHQSFF